MKKYMSRADPNDEPWRVEDAASDYTARADDYDDEEDDDADHDEEAYNHDCNLNADVEAYLPARADQNDPDDGPKPGMLLDILAGEHPRAKRKGKREHA